MVLNSEQRREKPTSRAFRLKARVEKSTCFLKGRSGGCSSVTLTGKINIVSVQKVPVGAALTQKPARGHPLWHLLELQCPSVQAWHHRLTSDVPHARLMTGPHHLLPLRHLPVVSGFTITSYAQTLFNAEAIELQCVVYCYCPVGLGHRPCPLSGKPSKAWRASLSHGTWRQVGESKWTWGQSVVCL